MLTYKSVFLGSSCNNRCLYCFEKHKKETLESPSVLHTINQDTHLDSIELYGGEPTLRNDFFPILDAARIKGFKRIKIVTNARKLSDNTFAFRTLEAGCYFYEIKVHHHRAEVHDYTTQVRGSLQETVEGLLNLRRLHSLHQKPFSAFISMRIPVSRNNYKDLGNIILAFIPYKIDRFIISFDDYALELPKALPYIQNAINLTILNRIWIVTEKIPLCIMEGYEHHVSEIYHPNYSNYSKSEKCRKCSIDGLCPGIGSGYAETFGFDQLKPLQGTNHNISDIRKLVNEKL